MAANLPQTGQGGQNHHPAFFKSVFLDFTFKRSKALEGEIARENARTEEILGWLNEHATPERLAEADDPESGTEENDLNRFTLVKELISDQFPGLDENYIDHLADRFLGV